MKTHDPPLDQSQLVERSGLAPNTVSGLINNRFTPTAETQEKVGRALDTTREEILAEVERLNSVESVVPLRSGKDREEDKDPILREAVDYGRRISRLSPLKRVAIYSTISAFEEAEDEARRAKDELARDRNHRKP